MYHKVSAFLLTDQHNRVHESPPTYIRTTAFTDVFQTFVNTYGIPRYQELNPAVLTTITFPFLFGIMYGDIGHGACLFALSLYLVLAYNKVTDSHALTEGPTRFRNAFFLMLTVMWCIVEGL